MRRLYWFCPENDLALASGQRRYTPPRIAVEMRRAGALLPTLWAEADDLVLTGDTPSADLTGLQAEPWGWSQYSRNELLRHGADESLMPTEEEVETMRRLSHRREGRRVLSLCGWPEEMLPAEASTVDEAMAAIAGRGGDAVVKLPWSCSGRGVVETRGHTADRLSESLAGMIRRQGSVMVEPRYDRRQDFAGLFRIEGGKARFRGYSVFATDAAGRYKGNIIAPQDYLRGLIEADAWEWIIRLEEALSQVYGKAYQGWAGVDMLSYGDESGSVKVMPCVEVNLRMTMGVAALLAAEAGRLPWERALLRTALPGEPLPAECVRLSAGPTPMTLLVEKLK